MGNQQILDYIKLLGPQCLPLLESQLKEEMARCAAEKIIHPPTGWQVLLKEKDGKWFSPGCVNKDNWPEEILDFDLILDIPNPNLVPEWSGP